VRVIDVGCLGGSSIDSFTHMHTNTRQALRVRADGLGPWLRALPDEALIHSWLPCLEGADLARCVGLVGFGWRVWRAGGGLIDRLIDRLLMVTRL
jgi:hypothetical protein